MRQAITGDTVSVHYKGTLPDGTEFDSSAEAEPISVTIGSGNVIPGFEQALLGMAAGETKSVVLPPEEAYGIHDPDLVHVVSRTQIPPEIDLQIGTVLQSRDPQGNVALLTVLSCDDSEVKLDANHPLAGKELTFDLKLVSIVE